MIESLGSSGIDPRVIVAGGAEIKGLDTTAPRTVEAVRDALVAQRYLASVALEMDLPVQAYSANAASFRFVLLLEFAHVRPAEFPK